MYLLQQKSAADWGLFFGHFHPVVVHLPIGMLVIAAVLEMVRFKTKNDGLNAAIVIILFWGFISAVIACVFGWLLSQPGGYDEDTLSLHQWMGIGVAVLAFLLWVIKRQKIVGAKPSKIYSALLIAMVLLLTFTGHLGGNMTHGEDYLTAYAPQPFKTLLGGNEETKKKERKPIADVNEAIVYADLVEPVLEIRCWSCHNEAKKKGGLRMDTEALLMKGGKNGIVVKPNDVAGSEMIRRMLLPEGDDERMPPKGKPALTNKEIELVKWWIASGASFTAKVKEVKKTEEVASYFAAISTSHAIAKSDSGKHAAIPLSPVFASKVSTGDKTAITNLQKENLIVTPVSQNGPFLEVSAVNASNFSDAKMPLLNGLNNQIVWLKLSNTKVTDAGLKEVSKYKNLVRLHVERTAITNNSVTTIKSLPHLEYLNITGTKIDDAGLLQLAANKSLRSIYCWETAITGKGVEAAKRLNPGIKIETGGSKMLEGVNQFSVTVKTP